MIRNLKALGLAAFACMAMGSVFASAASAQAGEFTAGHTKGATETGEHTGSIIKAEQYGDHNHFITAHGTTECTNSGVSFSGADEDGTAKAIELTPVYTECLSNNLPTTVEMNGCTYNFDQPNSVEESHETWTGTVDLICPEGNVVEIDVFLFGSHESHSFKVCTITVLPEDNLGHIIYHNNDNGEYDDLTATVDVEGLTYEEHGSNCATETELNHDGRYTGTVTVEAEDPTTGNPHDLWISTAE